MSDSESRTDVLVIGGGISGATFAHHAARAGRSVRLLEAKEHVGGCLRSVRTPSGYWFELGAHTCYNSYGALLEALEERELLGRLQPRGKPALRFIDGDRVVPGKNLVLLMRQMRALEVLRALPRWPGAKPEGRTVAEHYGRLVGPRNFARVLGPMLSAVPSQRADDFPADMLFKKRPRREDQPRSFTFENGLQGVVEALLDSPAIEVLHAARAVGVRSEGRAHTVELADGRRLRADVLALAVPPAAGAELLRTSHGALAEEVGAIGEVSVTSLGFAVRAELVRRIPYATFLIPFDDVFHSIVTRDVVPDPERRAFTFHFKPGPDAAARRARAAELLGLRAEQLESLTENEVRLPSPVLGHHERVARIDGLLAGTSVALTGNWFAGLSIEDCAGRSRAEWRRVGAAGPGAAAPEAFGEPASVR